MLLKYFLPLILFVSCFSTNLVFADSGYFVVDEIEVKQKDKNSLLAKQKALSKTPRLAFSKLISEELNLGEKVVSLMSDKQISDCIYDYSIEHEKHSDSFYIAELSYRFDKTSVSELLKKHGIKCNIVDEKQNKQSVKLAISIRDYVSRFVDLKTINHSVRTFSGEIVTFTMHKDSLNEFRKLGVRYVVI